MIELVVMLVLATSPESSEWPVLCQGYENSIEEDHQWPESEFSYENAKLAAERISAAVEGQYRPDWFELANMHTVVEGFHLRRLAMERIEAGDSRASAVADFCAFWAARPIID